MMTIHDRTTVRHYKRRSDSFLHAMEDLFTLDFVRYGNAIALLAVHAGMSLNDAILVALTGARCKESDHMAAVGKLKKACGSNRIEPTGVAHLEWLVKHKSKLTYGDDRLDEQKDVKKAYDKARSFAKWAYKALPQIAKEVE